MNHDRRTVLKGSAFGLFGVIPGYGGERWTHSDAAVNDKPAADPSDTQSTIPSASDGTQDFTPLVGGSSVIRFRSPDRMVGRTWCTNSKQRTSQREQ